MPTEPTPTPQADAYDYDDEGAPRGDRRRDERGQFAPEHPPEIVEIAQTFGLSDATIQTLTPAMLRATIRDMRRREVAEQQHRSRADAVDAAPRPVVPVQRAPEPPAEEDLPFDTTVVDPDIVAFLRQSRKEMREMREKLGQSEERVRQGEARQMHDVIDDAFAAMPDHVAFFGDEAGAELAATDPKMKRRVAVINAAGLAAGDGQRAIKRKIMQAVKDVYPDGVPKPGAKPGKPAPAGRPDPYTQAGANVPEDDERLTEAEWRQAQVERPTRLTPPKEKPGPKRAMRSVDRYLKQNLPDDYEGDGDEKNGFLGE